VPGGFPQSGEFDDFVLKVGSASSIINWNRASDDVGVFFPSYVFPFFPFFDCCPCFALALPSLCPRLAL
jgi:hypothetical protein